MIMLDRMEHFDNNVDVLSEYVNQDDELHGKADAALWSFNTLIEDNPQFRKEVQRFVGKRGKFLISDIERAAYMLTYSGYTLRI